MSNILFFVAFIGVWVILCIVLSALHVFSKMEKFQEEERDRFEQKKKAIRQTAHDARGELHELWKDIKHS